MKRSTPAGISKNSSKPADKLMACLNHAVTRGRPEYKQHRNYFSACGRWWSELKPDERETSADRPRLLRRPAPSRGRGHCRAAAGGAEVRLGTRNQRDTVQIIINTLQPARIEMLRRS